MGNVGSEIGDTFSAIGHGIAGVALGVKDLGEGAFTDDGFHFNDSKRFFDNTGILFKNATGYYGTEALDQSASEIAAAKTKKAAQTLTATLDPNSVVNKVNWSNSTATIRNASYGQKTGVGQVTPPTQIQSISDPMTKMARSTLRGSSANAFQASSNVADTKAVNNFVPNKTVPSNNVSSAGGVGVTTSNEQGDNQFKSGNPADPTKGLVPSPTS